MGVLLIVGSNNTPFVKTLVHFINSGSYLFIYKQYLSQGWMHFLPGAQQIRVKRIADVDVFYLEMNSTGDGPLSDLIMEDFQCS